MSRPTKSEDAAERMGILDKLDEIPDRFRLHHHADRYAGEDTWQEFCEKEEYQRGDYDRFEEEVNRVGNHWKAHMEGRDRHHALASPADVEAWCTDLLADKSVRRSHDYFLRVRRFYDWLQNEVQHPRRYHSVLIAASTGEAAGRIWRYKTDQTAQSRREYRRQGNE